MTKKELINKLEKQKEFYGQLLDDYMKNGGDENDNNYNYALGCWGTLKLILDILKLK